MFIRTADAVRLRASLFALAATVGLAACGGGGSGPAPTPTPTVSNTPPAFTSGTTATVAENSTGAFYTVAASDADGDPTSFSISGGADADLFTLSGTQLSFRAAPNYDMFGDSDEDNIYSVTIEAADGRGGRTSLPMQVSVTNEREGVSVVRLATGFGTDPVATAQRHSDSLLIARQDGQVIGVDVDSGVQTVYGNLFNGAETGRVLAIRDTGIVVLAVLDLDNDGVLVRAFDIRGRRNVTRFLVPRSALPASGPQPTAALFGNPGDKMYVALGDPGGDSAQDGAVALGKLVEIQVDPYCGASLYTTCMSTQIIGDGIHAPGGAALDSGGAILFDRGLDRLEEITYFNPAARPLDFGWPAYDGSFARVDNPPA